ncbi:VanZ family protein [Haloglomus litoreum]|uniref:VanZ family protein n=1 Tax=Haloglomus litoreum TaxID=3034026 RepID=UPI0023E774BC|nr:VanZ family protein [Haloglomus sp. DT116]
MTGSSPVARAVRRIRLLCPLAWAGFVLFASVVEPSGGPPAPSVLGLPGDKVLHGLTYAALAAAVAVGLATPRIRDAAAAPLGRRPVRRVAAVAVLVATAYGLAIEGVQYPIPYRTFDLLDAAANAVGAVVGAACWVAGVLVRRRVGR